MTVPSSLDFRPSSPFYRSISSPCTGRTLAEDNRHTHLLAFFSFSFSSSSLFLYIAKDTRAILELQEREQHLGPRHSGLRTEFPQSMLAGPAAREDFLFLSITVEHIPTGDFS